MRTIGLFDVKTHFSRIVEDLIEGREDAVIVSRHGKPVVKILPIPKTETSKRIGVARGHFKVPDDIDASNSTIAALFSTNRKA